MKHPIIAGSTDQSNLPQSNGPQSNEPDTLVWIGERDTLEFQEAYRYCESKVGQLAFRHSIDDALLRPASSVGRIIVARQTRRLLSADGIDQLTRSYPRASWLQLSGPLRSGCSHRMQGAPDAVGCSWHQWNQVLPRWLAVDRPTLRAESVPRTEFTTPTEPSTPASVVVVSQSVAAADPLMDWVVSLGATAIWSRGSDPFRVRNFDAVWWDDSAAPPATSVVWRQRIEACGSPSTHCRHAWFVNAPQFQCCQQAKLGGVDRILGKPFDIRCLAELLRPKETVIADRELTRLGRARLAA